MNTAKNEAQPRNIQTTPNAEQIRARAYEIYLTRGQEPGHEEEDWLAAERELVLTELESDIAEGGTPLTSVPNGPRGESHVRDGRPSSNGRGDGGASRRQAR